MFSLFQYGKIDKNLLCYGESIGDVKLCVNTKAITRYAPKVGLTFSKTTRDVGQIQKYVSLKETRYPKPISIFDLTSSISLPIIALTLQLQVLLC
jgi:hypothetical protein